MNILWSPPMTGAEPEQQTSLSAPRHPLGRAASPDQQERVLGVRTSLFTSSRNGRICDSQSGGEMIFHTDRLEIVVKI